MKYDQDEIWPFWMINRPKLSRYRVCYTTWIHVIWEHFNVAVKWSKCRGFLKKRWCILFFTWHFRMWHFFEFYAFEQVDCIDLQLRNEKVTLNQSYLMYVPTSLQILWSTSGTNLTEISMDFTSPLRHPPADSPNGWRANANAVPTARIHPRRRTLPLSTGEMLIK